MIDPMKSLEVLHKVGPLYAQAKGQRVQLEGYRNSLKAILMKQSGQPTAAAQEREALAHPDYIAHDKAIGIAVELEENYRVKMVTAQAALDVYRTMEASNRALDKRAA